MKEFVVPFVGLKEGLHQYDFEINPSFFEAFESELIRDAEFDILMELNKSSNMLILSFAAKGKIHVNCDRCGGNLELPMQVDDEIIVKFADVEAPELLDQILLISHDSYEIDVSHLIYEMLVLQLPSKRLHGKLKDCDQEVVQKLDALKNQKDENKESDPRWEALKKLK